MAIHDFIKKNKEEIFRFRVYRKVYTPYEIDKKFMDELDTTGFELCLITDAIDLGCGDYLMELQTGYIDEVDYKEVFKKSYKVYHRLSDIILEKFDCDNGIEEEYGKCL